MIFCKDSIKAALGPPLILHSIDMCLFCSIFQKKGNVRLLAIGAICGSILATAQAVFLFPNLYVKEGKEANL